MFKVIHQRCLSLINLHRSFRVLSNCLGPGDDKTKQREKPSVPLVCCGSGCTNCVWLQYADDLIKYYSDNFGSSDQGIREAIKEIEKLDDVNLKSYLIMEMYMRLRNR